MTAAPLLQIEGMQVSIGRVDVLTDVSLTVRAGSFTAVLGASGSGKTTLLRAVAGFERPQSGTIQLAGNAVDGGGRHVAPERRRLGYVPQEGALFPHLTVAGNVGFGLSRRRRTRARIDELLELVGLAELRGRYPHELSGGQQQRVALARALAIDPVLVLLDEPFASLDAALRVGIRADIARVLREAGTSVVLVTHDQQEALSLADQVAVLRDGRIAQTGSPEQIYAAPVDPDMARFLGAANLLPARISGSVASTALGQLQAMPVPYADAVALVRPEQIAIVADGAGVPATVLEQSYHGHDSMLTVRPERDCGADVLLLRVTGPALFPLGSTVHVQASGTTCTWPRHSS